MYIYITRSIYIYETIIVELLRFLLSVAVEHILSPQMQVISVVERWLTMRDIPGSNPIGDIAFFGDDICSTVT